MKPFIEIKPEQLLKVYGSSEVEAIEKKWIAAFCKNKPGLNIKQYKWHIFCGEGYPSVEGDLAEAAYKKHESPAYVVMSEDGEAFLTNKKPSNLNYIDAYVFPVNMSWTMAFTHEEGWMGPYFAVHKNYVQFEEKNKNHIEKLEQIEIARKNGWM